MKETKELRWSIDFLYSEGSIQDLTIGELERTFFDRNFRDFGSSKKTKGGILLPTAIGIYQNTFYNDTPFKNPEVERDVKTAVNLLDQLSYLAHTGELDLTSRDLIHIIYDPNVWKDTGMIRNNLGPDAERISISPLGEVPKFYEKDPNEIPNVFEEFPKNDNRIDKALKEIGKKWKKYGLTRKEYATIISARGNNGVVLL